MYSLPIRRADFRFLKDFHADYILKNFINDGGGFFGTCGGSMVAGGLENKPNTLNERIMDNLNLGISNVQVDYYEAMPLLCQIRGLEPESVGSMGSYLWYSGWNQTNYSYY